MMMGDDLITRVLVKGSRATFFAFRTTNAMYRFLHLNDPTLDIRRFSTFADLVRMGSGSKRHRTIFNFPANIPRMYQSKKWVPGSKSTAQFTTISIPTFTWKLLIRAKSRTVPSRIIGSLTARRNSGVE